MFQIPAVSTWEALHPALSHFPIVLLLIPPVMIALALFRFQYRDGLLAIAFWFLAAGTVSIYLSASTGDAARDAASKAPEIAKAIEVHESVGSAARAVFTALTVLLAAIHFGPGALKKKLDPKLWAALVAVYGALYVFATLLIFNAAHTGGVLVHKLGVHAKIA